MAVHTLTENRQGETGLEHIWLDSALLVAFFFLAMFQAYDFGTGDLALYLPFVYHLHDPGLFPDDSLMRSLGSYTPLIWKIVAFLMNWISAPSLFFMLFCLTIMVNIFGARFFYARVFGKDRGWIFFLLMLVLSKSSGAMNTFGLNPFGYFQPGGLALGMTLFSYGLIVGEQWIAAGIVTGTMFLYHPFTALYASLFFGGAMVLSGYKAHRLKKGIGMVSLILCGLPFLLPFFLKTVSHSDQPFDTDLWVQLARLRLSFAFFITQWVPDRFVHFALVFGTFWVFLKHDLFRRGLPIMLVTAASLVLLFIADIFSLKFLLQLNFARCTYFSFILVFGCVASRIANINQTTLSLKDAAWLFGAFALMIYPFVEKFNNIQSYMLVGCAVVVPVVLWRFKMRQWRAVSLIAGLIMVTSATGNRMYHRYAISGNALTTSWSGPWRDIQIWARDNIPVHETIMTPFYIEGFRSFSMHPIFTDFKDGGSHIFSPTIFDWWKRMQELGINLTMPKREYPFAYHTHAIEVARRSSIKYVVYEKRHANCRYTPLYENEEFGLIKISDTTPAPLVVKR